MRNKKAMAPLQILGFFILTVVLISIAVYMFIELGLWRNLSTIICTTLTTVGSFIRGLSVHLLFWAFISVSSIILALLFLLGKLCQNPIGAVVCLAIYATFLYFFTMGYYNVVENIPLISCENPSIQMGELEGDKTVSTDAFMKEVAEKTVDCWRMYTAGKYNPLARKTPPNPKTCFVFNFNVDEPFTVEELYRYLNIHEYGTGKNCNEVDNCHSYFDEIYGESYVRPSAVTSNDYISFIDSPLTGGAETKENNELYEADISRGRLFIKYYDDWKLVGHDFNDKESYDVSNEGYRYIHNDNIFWSFDEHVTEWEGVDQICGKTGQECCPGDECNDWNMCVNGFCEACGFTDQQCCSPSNPRDCESILICAGGTCIYSGY